jgi:hypothetical protein
MDVILYIANLAISTTEEELKTLFMQAGEVTAVSINKDRISGKSKGFGFFSMSARRGFPSPNMNYGMARRKKEYANDQFNVKYTHLPACEAGL